MKDYRSDLRRGDSQAKAYEFDSRRRLYDSYVSTHFRVNRAITGLSGEETAYFNWHFRCYLPSDNRARILDVGCGYGSLMLYLREHGYRNAVGADLSGEQVRVARSLGLDVVAAAAEDYLRGHRAEFDLIFAVDLIEHLNRDELLTLLDAARLALKQEGKLVLQSPNADSPFSGRLRYGDLTHEQSFTAESIAQALRVCKFSKVQVRAVEPAVHGPVSACRWLLWRAIRAFLTAYLAVETGVVRGHIVSQNLIAVAVKPSEE